MTENASSAGIRHLRVGGTMLVILSLALYLLLQSHSLWESPTLLPDRWQYIFYPIRDLFPQDWVTAQKSSPLGLLNSFLYLGIVGAMFVVYLKTVRTLFRGRTLPGLRSGRQLHLLLAFTGSALAILFIVPGTFSTDLYSYVSYGRISAAYGDNPYFSPPAAYTWYDQTNWLQWVVWKHTVSAYGPVWLGIAHALAALAQWLDGDIVTHLLMHKALASGAHLLNVLLLWKVSGIVVDRYWPNMKSASFEWNTSVRTAITATYAWNPLALIEFGVSGHNDVLMITAMLAALWLHLRGHWRIAVLALALGSLVKVTLLLVVPAYLWLLICEMASNRNVSSTAISRLLKGIQAMLILLLTWVMAYLPWWRGAETMEHLSGGPAAQFFIHSLASVVRYNFAEGIASIAEAWRFQPTQFWSAEEVGARLEWPTRWGLLLIAGVALLMFTLRSRDFPSMLRAWGWGLLVYLTVGSVWYWPWYATWIIVPVALLGPGRLFNAVQLLCATSLTVYALWPRVMPPFDWVTSWTGLVVALPPLIYLAVSGLRTGARTERPVYREEPGEASTVPG